MYLKTVATARSETHLEVPDTMNTSNRIKSTNNFREISRTLFSIKYLQYPLAAFEHGTMFTNDAVFAFLHVLHLKEIIVVVQKKVLRFW